MKLVALKECPQGQQPGQVFEAPDAHANVLILVGAAKPYVPDETFASQADDSAPSPRRRYRRRDLRAEES